MSDRIIHEMKLSSDFVVDKGRDVVSTTEIELFHHFFEKKIEKLLKIFNKKAIRLKQFVFASGTLVGWKDPNRNPDILSNFRLTCAEFSIHTLIGYKGLEGFQLEIAKSILYLEI